MWGRANYSRRHSLRWRGLQEGLWARLRALLDHFHCETVLPSRQTLNGEGDTSLMLRGSMGQGMECWESKAGSMTSLTCPRENNRKRKRKLSDQETQEWAVPGGAGRELRGSGVPCTLCSDAPAWGPGMHPWEEVAAAVCRGDNMWEARKWTDSDEKETGGNDSGHRPGLKTETGQYVSNSGLQISVLP